MRLKKREYVYAGEAPVLTEKQASSFILAYQKAILAALVKRDILTISQAERCMEKLRRQRY